MKKILLYIVLGAALSSCIYPYNMDLESNPDQTLVVDGKILVGGATTFRLSYLMPLKGNATGVALGTGWVEDDQGNRYDRLPDYVIFSDRPTGGEIIAPIPTYPTNTIQIDTYKAPLGRKYRGVVQCDGETYLSDWLEPDPAPVIEKINFSADETNVTVSVDLNAGLEGSGYIGFMYEETWEFHSDYYPEYMIYPPNWSSYVSTMEGQFEYPYYWCWRSANPQSMILLDYTTMDGPAVRQFPLKRFPRTDSRNHKRYSINVRAFALSKEAYEYNRQTQEISEIGGDLFSPDPGALPSNLVCESNPEREVMGLILAGDVTAKRAFMYGDYYIYRDPGFDFVDVPEEKREHYYYDLNYRPVKDTRTPENTVFVGWAPHYCINCIEAGGTQTRPDFWED